MESLIQQQSQGLADPAAIAAAEGVKAMIQSAYMMALNRPRKADQARAKILAACKRPEFAARAQYSKPVGGKSMTGPSIRLAELAVREWGNIRSDVQVVYEDRMTRRVKVNMLDLETNASFAKEITISKTVERRESKGREVLGERANTTGQIVFIVAATDDEIQVKESAMISKVIRNEGLRLIPSDIIDEAMEIAQETLRNRDAQDPESAKKRMVDAFSEFGVWPQDLENYLRHPLAQISPIELGELRKVYQAIKDGDARWSDYIEAPAAEAKPSTAERVKEQIRKPAPSGVSTAQIQSALRGVGLDVKTANDCLGRSIYDLTEEEKAALIADPAAFSKRVSAWLDEREAAKESADAQ
jgi:hypothetical protein